MRNPLAARLGLHDADLKREAKLHRWCADLAERILTPAGGPAETTVGWRWTEAGLTAAEALAADWSGWDAFTPRTVWARAQAHTWFAAEIVVPEAAAGRPLVLRVASQWTDRPGTTDPQCLAWLDGRPAQGIDGNHTEVLIARDAVPGARHRLLVNAFTFFDRPLVGFGAELLVRHEAAERLYHDLMTPLEVACTLPQTDARRHAVLDRVERALKLIDRRGGVTPEFEASLPAAQAVADEIYALPDTGIRPVVTAVGHTHLDVAWLWRVRHTRDKTARTFATVLSLMEEFPDFVFMYNQAVLFDYLRQDYPEIWAGVLDRQKDGRFEVEGAMWVEPDANIVSGESLVRQIMRGKRFHREQFGVMPRTVWLPDTFGYSANLPQIMKGSGLDTFITSKLSWNDTNRFPHDTFFWTGIDGSEVRAQLITTQRHDSDRIYTTYNSDLSVSEVMGAWRRYEPKSAGDEVLVAFGYGDGGGGPTRAMIERGRRLQRGIPGGPDLRLESVGAFVERLEQRMEAARDRFPTWSGELYLEYHRGTLTSQAANKRDNRRAEGLLREAEALATLAWLDGADYPGEALGAAWEIALVNQFHDILPGTSIAEAYRDSAADYADLFGRLEGQEGLIGTALDRLGSAGDGALRVVNLLGQPRHDLAGFPGGTAVRQGDGPALPLQTLHAADGGTRRVAPVTAPALGWTTVTLAEAGEAPETGLSVSSGHLENAALRVRFDARGEIASVLDKSRGRELLPDGAVANRLTAYEDKPVDWDAWDIEAYFDEIGWPLADAPATIEVVETGPWRAALRIARRYRESTVVQVVSLRHDARQVEFDSFVDWRERHTVLKAGFAFDLNSSEIRSEIQFGHVTRATHRNTSWDRARFEASMHRWVDLSEADFGAALLNDSKYGYDAVGARVNLTLLRGPTFPDPDADLGPHRFRYALAVHDGRADLASVPRAAERFNAPLRVVAGSGAAWGADTASFLRCDCPNVTIETLKRAEDGAGVVLRLFEHANRRAACRIEFARAPVSVRRASLMEEPGDPVGVAGTAVELALRPFEIATLLIDFG